MHVMHMGHLSLEQGPTGDGLPFRSDRNIPYVVHELRTKAVRAGAKIFVTLLSRNRRHVRFAKPRRRFDQSIEHCLQIERRAADDLEDVGGGGLLLKGLRKIARARLYLIEQPHILDRDHRLIGEGPDKLDVVGGERSGLLARDADDADWRAAA